MNLGQCCRMSKTIINYTASFSNSYLNVVFPSVICDHFMRLLPAIYLHSLNQEVNSLFSLPTQIISYVANFKCLNIRVYSVSTFT